MLLVLTKNKKYVTYEINMRILGGGGGGNSN